MRTRPPGRAGRSMERVKRIRANSLGVEKAPKLDQNALDKARFVRLEHRNWRLTDRFSTALGAILAVNMRLVARFFAVPRH